MGMFNRQSSSANDQATSRELEQRAKEAYRQYRTAAKARDAAAVALDQAETSGAPHGEIAAARSAFATCSTRMRAAMETSHEAAVQRHAHRGQ
ncbi:hypothetical protein [Phaeacidiphilus oryzae]|uniref:hypothetical protein n=1 Tax=Phaeacidiphilus oryzae TaxID=348818 RepID=UPI0005634B40|nr:hypothetical protein [Phaeacidiphilus oryzae]